jgi:hypothetical protein
MPEILRGAIIKLKYFHLTLMTCDHFDISIVNTHIGPIADSMTGRILLLGSAAFVVAFV